MTAPPVQLTSGQSHGEDEEGGVDDWRPSWCLRLTRMVCSVVVGCEITWEGSVMLRKRKN